MNILSIQSHVAYGHVGNASAAFPLQRLGHEVWAVNTVQFSNHTGYGAWRGDVVSAETVREIVLGVEERGALARCDGVLSGYMGSPAIGEAILDAVARTKRANPGALYACDPVIGDVGEGVYVRPGVPELIRDRAVPLADIVTPNQFELQLLTGIAVNRLADAWLASRALSAFGPRVVMTTSLRTSETPDDAIDMLVCDGDGAWRLRTPRLPVEVNGAGDAIAALFFAHYLETRSAFVALSRAASSVYGLLKMTAEAGSREILTVEAQEEFVRPSRVFQAEPV